MPQTTKPRLIVGTGTVSKIGHSFDLPLQAVQRTDDMQLPVSRGRWLWLLLLLPGLAAAYLIFSVLSPNQAQVPDPAMPAVTGKPAAVFGLGKIVPEGDVITVAPPFGAGDARLARIAVKEGDVVAAGQILAVLDSELLLKAAIDVRDADVEVQRRTVEQVRQASIASRTETLATVDGARTAAKVAQDDYDRIEGLVEKGAVARAVLEQKEAALGNARGTLGRAEATLSRFEAGEVSGQQDLLVAKQKLALAQADFRRAQVELEKAYVRAPIAGTILALNSKIGEKPATSGIASMANLDRMTADVEIYQNAISRVDVGNAVALTSDALQQKLTGHVTRIGLIVEKQKVTDANPAANTDARVVIVRVAIDPDSAVLARRYVDLQVTAEITPASPDP